MNSERKRAFVARRMQAGLCTWCGKEKEPARKEKRLCENCKNRMYELRLRRWDANPVTRVTDLRNAAESNQSRRRERIAKGLCPECGRKNTGSYRLCPECHERQREYMNAYLARKRLEKYMK